MSKVRPMAAALRVAAMWLLALSMLWAPLGLLAAVANPCGVSCPCEEEAADEGAEAHPAAAGTDAEGSQQEEEGRGEDCPDDCPDCSCCLGVVTGVAVAAAPSIPAATFVSTAPFVPRGQAASARIAGVFRPPRVHG